MDSAGSHRAVLRRPSSSRTYPSSSVVRTLSSAVTGQRVRTSRPTVRPSGSDSGSTSVPAPAVTAPGPERTTSRSTPSCQGTQSVSPTRNRSTGPYRPSTRDSTARHCTCRNRTWTRGVPPGRMSTDAVSPLRSPTRAGLGPLRREQAELPAQLVLGRVRPVRVEQVALVQHGVGDPAGRDHAHRGTSVGSSSAERRLPADQPAGGPVAGQRVEAVAIEPDPAAAGEVGVHHRPPDRHRQPVHRLLVPGHLLDREPGLAAGENRPAEQQPQRHLAVAQRVQVLRRGHLEVVRAGDRKVELDLAGEPRHQRDGVRPQERPQRLRPPLGRPEQVGQPLLLALGVLAALRLDLDLRPQRDRVHGRPGRLGQPDPESAASAPPRTAPASRRGR